jgi:hypothetical protein
MAVGRDCYYFPGDFFDQSVGLLRFPNLAAC